MSSNTAAELDVHDSLIREAFIDPIRTVIVVDDEYPTLDSLIAKETSGGDPWNGSKEDVERVHRLLGFARARTKPWLVDVHDGKKVTTEAECGIAPHLDHSDLLVLDYHLDGNEGNGDKAIGILRKLARSNHFNLVIVYTKGYQGDLNRVVREIALGLSYPEPAFPLDADDRKSLVDALEQWEDDNEGITEKLKAQVSDDTYLRLRTKCPGNSDGILGMEEGKNILALWNKRPAANKIKPKQLTKWLLAEKQQELANQFSKEPLGNIQVGQSADINWIRTDKLFITVLSKECAPDEFETRLTDAIKTSSPSPHRLLLTKMRAEIDQQGVSAEAVILGNRHIQAEWLNDFLKPDTVDTRAVIHNTINRHWEALGDELSNNLRDFAEELRSHFAPIGIKGVMEQCGLSPADVGTDESLKRFNCFSSTKPIDRSHLTTGHIFQIDIDGGAPSFWICLSPACDMIPGQKSYPGLSDCIPFIAAKLDEVSGNKALEKATENVFLFLEIDDEIKTLSIYKDGNPAGKLEWEQKFARNKGRFQQENQITLGSIVEAETELKGEWLDARVVAQLRSEYALNLLQRIGALLSRPGLGMNFKNKK
ncbi:MAG: hypothetical protein KGZ83_01240 [Sulfuricella sp.]|nr:hypothetical protein [Sulfuricella sp.]